MRKKLYDLTVENLKSENKIYFCMSEDETGFGVRVYPSGQKTFVYKYKVDGVQKMLTLGEYPSMSLKDARDEYLKASLKVKDLRKGKADGLDPVKEIKLKAERRIKEDAEQRQAPTVAALIKEFIELHSKKKNRNWQDVERMLNKEVLPEWGKRKAKDITKRDVNLLLVKIVERGSPATSNQVLKHIRKMFNFAIEEDIQQHSPCLGVKMKSKETPRERNLSEDEIKTLWKILDDCSISDDVRRALKLILVTAQRPGEVSAMHTGEIDGRWWTIPAERIYKAQAKNHLTHRVYLTDIALELIGDTTGKGYIFPCPHNGKEQPIDTRAVAHAVRRNLEYPVSYKGKAVYDKNGKPVTENRLNIEQFTPHDLRRTATTLLSKCKIIKEHRERVLNHKQEKLDGTYNQHDYDDEKQAALETLERKIISIISGKANNVIPIRGALKAA